MTEPLSVSDFSKRIKEKYPQYEAVDDEKLARSIVEKYPSYASQVNFDDDPSLGQVGAGLATEVVAGEGAKLIGAATGTAVLPGVGTAIGYGIGAIAGGVSGSIAAQRIEGRDEISWGRVVADSLINLVPGSKIAKGGKFVQRAGSAAVRQGAAGAVIAPAAQTVESVIEEGELPSANELGQMAVVGGALGSGLGISSEAASKLYKKFAGMKPEQIQARVLAGDKDAVKLVDAVAEAGGMEATESAGPRDFLRKLGTYAGARVAPSRVVGKDVVQVAKEAQDVFAGGKFYGAELGKRISNAVKVADDPEVAGDAVAAYLSGQSVKLPPSVQNISEELAAARKEIYAKQKEILANHYNGTRVLPEPLLNEIEDSMTRGDYLTREYQFFENVEYKPSKQDTAALKQSLMKDGKSEAEVEQFIADLNTKRGNPEDVIRFVASTPTGVLKEKKDLSPELRRYLGEITDPGERIAGTVSRLSRLVAFDTADARIRDIFLDMGIARRAGQGIDDSRMVPLNLRRGAATDAQGNPLYVDKDVSRALNSIYAPNKDIDGLNATENLVRDVFGSGIALSKATKVLMNPPSYMVQVFGNLANLAGMGMNPMAGTRSGARFGFSQFQRYAKNLSIKDLNRFKRAIELDLAQPGATISDIRKGLEGKFVGQKFQGMLNPLGKAYSIPDIMFRVSAWENYQRFLRKAAPTLTQPDQQARLEEIAAKLTNDTYQNYAFLNEGLKTLSKYGVLGQFAAFSLELIRNQYNQARLIYEMLNGNFGRELASEFGTVNQTAIRKEGAKRLAALASVYAGATAGIAEINRRLGNVDEEKEQAYRESVIPDWDKRGAMILWEGEGNKLYHKNASYMIPHAQMGGVVMSAFRGEGFGQAATEALETLLADIGGEGNFVMNAMVPALQNLRLGKEEKISKKTDPFANRLERLGWFVHEEFMPGLFREIKKATDQVDIQPAQQTALRQAGIRINDTTIEEGASFKLSSAKTDLQSIRRDYARAQFREAGSDLQSTYNQLNQTYKDNFSKLVMHAENYRTLGLSEGEVIKMFRDSGISGKDALLAIDGVVPDMPSANRDTPTSRWENMAGLSESQKREQIRNIEDKNMRDSLMRKMKREKELERRGVSERERVILSLGVNDGERANFIYKEMTASDNPENVLRNYVRKRIATDDVVRQIRLKERAN